MKGLELSERFYEEYGRPMIAGQFPDFEGRIAVGIAGEGSDCFGYDDELSRDHDFEAGFCLWILDEDIHELEFRLSRAYRRLPDSFLGVSKGRQSLWGANRRGVISVGEFYSRFTGRPGLPESLMEWLRLPEHSLACAGNGKVFRDDLGEFSGIRREILNGYPEDVRKKKIAARAVLMAQAGQYNFSRCEKRGETGAAAMALFEFIRSALSMAFLLENRYMPYYKWAFRSGRELPEGAGLVRRLECLAAAGFGFGEGRPVSGAGFGRERTGWSAAAVEEEIESICKAVVQRLKKQDLTGGDWDYLEPHAYEVMERIHDGELRNLHVMEG